MRTQQYLTESDLCRQLDQPAFRLTGNGAGQVQATGGFCTARATQPVQRRHAGHLAIDRLLQ